jgi:hypothetical protein
VRCLEEGEQLNKNRALEHLGRKGLDQLGCTGPLELVDVDLEQLGRTGPVELGEVDLEQWGSAGPGEPDGTGSEQFYPYPRVHLGHEEPPVSCLEEERLKDNRVLEHLSCMGPEQLGSTGVGEPDETGSEQFRTAGQCLRTYGGREVWEGSVAELLMQGSCPPSCQ